MRLRVTTPTTVVVDAEDTMSVRGEDATGHFGILPGHADFLTVLEPSVVTWRDAADGEHFVAVRGGILTVRGGRTIDVVTREAVAGDDLTVLREAVLAHLRDAAREETQERARAAQLHMALVRYVTRYLRSGGHQHAASGDAAVRHRLADRP